MGGCAVGLADRPLGVRSPGCSLERRPLGAAGCALALDSGRLALNRHFENLELPLRARART